MQTIKFFFIRPIQVIGQNTKSWESMVANCLLFLLFVLFFAFLNDIKNPVGYLDNGFSSGDLGESGGCCGNYVLSTVLDFTGTFFFFDAGSG